MTGAVVIVAVAGFLLLVTLLTSIYFIYKILRMDDSGSDIGIILSTYEPSRKLMIVECYSTIVAILITCATVACVIGSFEIRKPEEHHRLFVVVCSMDLTAVCILFVLATIRHKYKKKPYIKLFVAFGAIMLLMGCFAMFLVVVGTYSIQYYFAFATLMWSSASFVSPYAEIELASRSNPVIHRVILVPFTGVDVSTLSPP